MRTRIRTYGPYVAAIAVVLAACGFVATLGAGLLIQERTDSKLCESNVENRAAIRSTWLAAQQLILPASDNPEAIRMFFDSVLEPIPPLECVGNKPVPVG